MKNLDHPITTSTPVITSHPGSQERTGASRWVDGIIWTLILAGWCGAAYLALLNASS